MNSKVFLCLHIFTQQKYVQYIVIFRTSITFIQHINMSQVAKVFVFSSPVSSVRKTYLGCRAENRTLAWCQRTIYQLSNVALYWVKQRPYLAYRKPTHYQLSNVACYWDRQRPYRATPRHHWATPRTYLATPHPINLCRNLIEVRGSPSELRRTLPMHDAP
jgi:hypothetical protein